MNLIARIWKDILSGQNLDVYITIVLSVTVALLGITGVTDINVIVAAVLATLALVSGSLLVNRQENEKLQAALFKIENSGSLAEKFLKEGLSDSQFVELIRNSNKVFFWGTSLSTLIPILKDELEKNLQLNLEARFLLLKPGGNAVNTAAFRSYRNLDKNYINTSIKTSLAHLSQLLTRVPNGHLQCRVVDYLAPYVIMGFDPNLPTGQIFVVLDTFRVPISTRPYFQLTLRSDKHWFTFFREQFESVWSEATICGNIPLDK